MRILGKQELLPALKERLAAAETVEIAVAWATASDALELVTSFCASAKKKPRIIVGISGNFTTPVALERLREIAELRVTPGEDGLFHPKFYRFVGRQETYCWCGSANLSRNGFGLNDEAVLEYLDDGVGRRWFADLWSKLERDDGVIDEYIANWTPPLRDRQRKPVANAPRGDPVGLLGKRIANWKEYVVALHRCDAYWLRHGAGLSVLGEHTSWTGTISEAGIIAREPDWTRLSHLDCKILLGIANAASGLLGSMGAAGEAKKVFGKSNDATLLATREEIRRAVQSVQGASPRDVPEAASHAMAAVISLHGFGPGIATRFLALVRPDCCVSVNGGSKSRLSSISGISASSLEKPEGYRELLEWVQRQPWHQAPQPRDPYESLLWSMRAALLDAFVYEPVDS